MKSTHREKGVRKRFRRYQYTQKGFRKAFRRYSYTPKGV